MKSGLIFHTDQGSQYKSKTFQLYLQKLGVTSSMSGRGNCYDNAVVVIDCKMTHTIK